MVEKLFGAGVTSSCPVPHTVLKVSLTSEVVRCVYVCSKHQDAGDLQNSGSSENIQENYYYVIVLLFALEEPSRLRGFRRLLV